MRYHYVSPLSWYNSFLLCRKKDEPNEQRATGCHIHTIAGAKKSSSSLLFHSEVRKNWEKSVALNLTTSLLHLDKFHRQILSVFRHKYTSVTAHLTCSSKPLLPHLPHIFCFWRKRTKKYDRSEGVGERGEGEKKVFLTLFRKVNDKLSRLIPPFSSSEVEKVLLPALTHILGLSVTFIL